jgi:hypothetical protein
MKYLQQLTNHVIQLNGIFGWIFSSSIGSLIVVICLVVVDRSIVGKRESEKRSAFRLFCSRKKFWIGEGRENTLAGKIVRTLLTAVSPFTHVRATVWVAGSGAVAMSTRLIGTYHEPISADLGALEPPLMPQIVADPPVLACYRLFLRLGIEESQQLGPDPFVRRARDARAFRITGLIAGSQIGPAMTSDSTGAAVTGSCNLTGKFGC